MDFELSEGIKVMKKMWVQNSDSKVVDLFATKT